MDEIQVCEGLTVRWERISGQWTQYRVWAEREGKRIPWERTTDDPHTVANAAAAKLREMCGIREPEATSWLATMVIAGVTSPFFWFAVLGAMLAAR